MVFHVGALIRLNEVALLRKVKRISSVSGGSITAGVLGTSWNDLKFEGDVASKFDLVISHQEDGQYIGQRQSNNRWHLLPGSISDKVAKAYNSILFHGAKLDALPDNSQPGNPRFVINATNVQTAALWRFSRNYMGDYRVGLVERPDVLLAAAVAASSAFPPVLSPSTLQIDQPVVNTPGADLHKQPYIKTAVLSDGGVYDNLGLETITKRYATLLVSDAGQDHSRGGSPPRLGSAFTADFDTVDNQVRSLRKRHLIESDPTQGT